jgi:hypothetical protein
MSLLPAELDREAPSPGARLTLRELGRWQGPWSRMLCRLVKGNEVVCFAGQI